MPPHDSHPSASPRPLPAPSQAHHPSKMNPVVGDMVSLASDSAARPHGSGALTGQLTFYLQVVSALCYYTRKSHETFHL